MNKLKDIRDELELIRNIIIKRTHHYTINYDPDSWNCSCDGIDYAIKIIDDALQEDEEK